MVLMLASAVMLCFTSCLNEAADPNSGEGSLPANVATLSEQVVAMKTSVAAIEALSADFSETDGLEEAAAQLEYCATLVKEHIASVEAGMSGVNAAIAAMKLQKEIASVVGEIKASCGVSAEILLLEKSVKAWLGDKFENFYVASSESARVKTMVTVVEDQELTIDALISDVEAGLRVEDTDGSLSKVGDDVTMTTKKLNALDQKLTSLCTELKSGYEAAIKNSGSDVKKSLKTLNSNAASTLQDVDASISTLSVSLAESAVTIAELQERLAKVEADVQDLIKMIQSLTFVSEYSDDKAVAYYSMTDKINLERFAEGKKDRVPEETFDLTFLVRPAAVADALAQTWEESLSVIGYYANAIQSKSTTNIREFEIVNAISTTGKGLLTVTVNNAFDDEFYFKEKGAKLALAVESGMNNCTSKFVEIVPRDISGKVYAESITISATSISIQNGETYQLSAVVTPSNVTDNGVIFEGGEPYADVDANGLITGKAVGKATVTVKANATDEFGRPLSADCEIEVTPSIKIKGPDHVELGHTETLTLESPMYIDPKDVRWEIDSYLGGSYIELEKNADGSCSVTSKMIYHSEDRIPQVDGSTLVTKAYYKPITVKCIIEAVDQTYNIFHKLYSVKVQPKAIIFEGIPNNESTKVMKIGDSYQLNGTMEPEEVDSECFKIVYQSNANYYAQVEFNSGKVDAVSVGTAYISALVQNKTSENFLYPLDRVTRRTIAIQVDPYFITEISLPATMNLAPGATATLTASFTSDVDGKQPTNTSLTWTSSNPSIVSVDSKTGEMTANAEGTVAITATTSEGAASGSAIKTATCMETVKAPVTEVKVGDYYYSDGTWGSNPDPSGKTVIGVIFSNANAVASDPLLFNDYPNCSNGLAVGLTEVITTYGEFCFADNVMDMTAADHIYAYFNNKGVSIIETDVINGYTLTQLLGEYRTLYQSKDRDYCAMFDSVTGVAATYSPAAPSKASTWYIPSYKEMTILADPNNLEKVNASITQKNGTPIGNSTYWMTTLKSTNKWNDLFAYPFNIASREWSQTSGTLGEKNHPVRVVLAF